MAHDARGRGAFSTTLVGICFALAALPGLAFAQEDLSGEEIEEFEAHVERGSRHLEAGEYPEAIEALEEARKIVDHPRISLNIAIAYKRWGRCQEAERRLERVAATVPDGSKVERRAKRHLGDIDGCVELARLVVRCDPADDTTLEFNGERFACPLEREVRVGSHSVVAGAPGYETKTATVNVRPNETTRIEVRLRPTKGEASSSAAVWPTYASWGAVALGGGLLAWGLGTDVGAVSRSEAIAEAQQRGDTARVEALKRQADRARTRTIILYSVGAGLAGAGIAWKLYDASASEAGGTSRLGWTVGVTGRGVEATIHW